jgi:ABC-type antimicrobial peptide transport system permease subunit
MKKALFKTAARSLWFNRKDAFYQIIIIAILAAIICGSLMTGDSVRKSLAKSLSEKLGNCDLLISSGSRYFDASIARRISEKTGTGTAALLENEGYCRNFSTGTTALHTKIFGITTDFFKFHGIDLVGPDEGTVFLNESLSQILGAGTGDEVIVSFTEVDPVPSNAPFAPSGGNESSRVFKIAGILTGSQSGNFSLGTSQSVPQNIFLNIKDLKSSSQGKQKANRLLIHNATRYADSVYFGALKDILSPADIGLSVRRSGKTGEPELISDRIFIDNEIAGEIVRNTPEAAPVITYLANSFQVTGKTTPYSFISALPGSMSALAGNDRILISRWLADDLGVKSGDSLLITWYDPGMGNRLKEKEKRFVISGIAGKDFKYSDPSLMPDFPGISGSTTCSGWDAGVPILLGSIREKDEEYWNLYRGTPKAFISYDTGKLLWGNNFGSATSFRYPAGTDTSSIVKRLTGVIDPSKAGFSLTNLREKNRKAASEGVDFGTLFLGLSFFIILSCIILLSISLSLYFDSRKEQVRTYNALGFRRSEISIIVSSEALFLSISGAVFGIILGYFVNLLIIKGLNGVWRGAVQTSTLTAGLSLIPFLTGFAATVLISAIMIRIKLKRHLDKLSVSARKVHHPGLKPHNYLFLLIFISLSLLFFCLAFTVSSKAILFSFAGGSFLFAGLILALLRFYSMKPMGKRAEKGDYSRLYYAFNPSHAVTPAIFLAAGIFAVIITGANRQVVNDKMLLPSGGTGGFLLWVESAIPVRYSLDSPEGKKEFGFDEPELKELKFVEAKRISGDDASCLNISHVTAPPILGLDPQLFIEKGSFSFVTRIKEAKERTPWELVNETGKDNIIYGIADQTVLEWGLKIKTGDTLKYVAESGTTLNIVICAGLQSSVFQGYILVGAVNFGKYFPSVGGSSVFLADGRKELSDFYISTISERLAGSGIAVEPAIQKLASFFEVTNTYLQVFMMLGAFGLILGAAGLGFILKRNFNSRKHEFALMLASGYTTGRIKRLLLKDQIIILFWGIFTGSISALTATWPSVKQGTDLPWALLSVMLVAMILTGIAALLISVNQLNKEELVSLLRKE